MEDHFFGCLDNGNTARRSLLRSSSGKHNLVAMAFAAALCGEGGGRGEVREMMMQTAETYMANEGACQAEDGIGTTKGSDLTTA